MRWTGYVARIGEERGVYRVLVGKPEGRRPLGRPRRRWVDNIRTDLQENHGEEEIEDDPGNDGNASMPEQVKRPNPWRKMMKMMMMISRRWDVGIWTELDWPRIETDGGRL